MEPKQDERSLAVKVLPAFKSRMVMFEPFLAGRELYGNFFRKCPNLSFDFCSLADSLSAFWLLCRESDQRVVIGYVVFWFFSRHTI